MNEGMACGPKVSSLAFPFKFLIMFLFLLHSAVLLSEGESSQVCEREIFFSSLSRFPSFFSSLSRSAAIHTEQRSSFGQDRDRASSSSSTTVTAAPPVLKAQSAEQIFIWSTARCSYPLQWQLVKPCGSEVQQGAQAPATSPAEYSISGVNKLVLVPA